MLLSLFPRTLMVHIFKLIKSCLIRCKPGYFLRPLEGSKLPKRIKASCSLANKRILDQYNWLVKVNGQFQCEKDCPYPFEQSPKLIKFVQRTWDDTMNTTDTALLVSFAYPSKTKSLGWSLLLRFAR